MKLPEDPVILLSVINTKLRDMYKSLDDLCDDANIDKKYIEDKLNSIGYKYNEKQNQFK
ncbi:DUF4250 domain-containing protein [Porcipelethomonas sp.]|uniref:DUF4250 domain-containing protein n=1 Tax=Porcipelethomonas sp. TaxID=2981675 RepID=UPI003EFA3602